MAPRKITTKAVPRDDYKGRWRNALDRRAAMERELAADAFDPVCVLAVQAAIAGSDAFTIWHLGERSAADRHHDALAVFTRVTVVKDTSDARKHLQRLLAEKTDLEYSGRPVKRADAESIAEHTRRFLDFVAKHLPIK